MALSPRAAQPVRGYDEEYCADKPTGRRIGISLSGGGIRSAAFNLGALQALQEEEVLGSAQYLAAVSGGGYIASALTISHAYAEPEAEDGHPLWAHGSPEERLLRRNTNYLAPGTAGRTWLVMNVLHGFVLNYLPFLLSGFVIGRVLGWLAHLAGVSLAHPPSSLVLVPLYGVGVFVLAAVAVVARARWRDGHKGVRGYGESSLEKWAALCIRLAGLALGVLALPVARRALRRGHPRGARPPRAARRRAAVADRGRGRVAADRLGAGRDRGAAGPPSAGAVGGVRGGGARERGAARGAAAGVAGVRHPRRHLGVGRRGAWSRPRPWCC